MMRHFIAPDVLIPFILSVISDTLSATSPFFPLAHALLYKIA